MTTPGAGTEFGGGKDSATRPSRSSGPASVPLRKSPPRISAAGSSTKSKSPGAAPARHWPSPVGLTPGLQAPHVVDRGNQLATHSERVPTMSKAPSVDVQLLRDPVLTAANPVPVWRAVVLLPGPGPGGPSTAACHSAFDGSRLRAFLHAACAWNHVMFADGCTAGRLTA